MKIKHIGTVFCLLLLTITALSSGCSFGNISAQKTAPKESVSTRPAESPTPAYKPLKRVSKDIIDSDKSDKKEEKPKGKAKK